MNINPLDLPTGILYAYFSFITKRGNEEETK